MKFHLWQAYNPKKISVEITKNLKDTLKEFIEKNIKDVARRIKVNPARLYEYFIYQEKPIPLDKLMKISKLFKISQEDIEKEIVLYKQMYVPRKNSIKEPKLPLKITPYFTAIVSHLFFDGSVPEDGKGTYYSQKEIKIMDLFIKKLYDTFGKIDYSLTKDIKDILKLRVPRLIGEICKKIYQIKTFNGRNAEISKFIFSLNKEHKSAFILSAILDEGSIGYDGNIWFGVSNKKLCEQVKKLCVELKLEVSDMKCKEGENNHYYFRILSKTKFLKLYEKIEKKFPLISLDYKKERLESYFQTLKNPGLRTKEGGNKRKMKILKSINNKEKSPNELSQEIKIPVRTIRRHLQDLIRIKKVKRRKYKNNYLYISLQPH